LAGVQVGGPGRARRGDLKVDVVADDERDHVGAAVHHQRLADVRAAGEQAHHPVREAAERLGQPQRRQRRVRRGLDDHGVAGREGRGELPGQQEQRIVPGHDRGHHPDRLLEHQRELPLLDRRDHPPALVAAELGVVGEGVGGPADLVGVLDQRLAALQRHQPAQLLGVVAEPGGDPVEQLAPLAGRGPPPPGQRRPRRPHGGVDLRRRGGPHLGDRFLGGRVAHHLDRAVAGDLGPPIHIAVLTAEGY
jgi:hypothetical protein